MKFYLYPKHDLINMGWKYNEFGHLYHPKYMCSINHRAFKYLGKTVKFKISHNCKVVYYGSHALDYLVLDNNQGFFVLSFWDKVKRIFKRGKK